MKIIKNCMLKTRTFRVIGFKHQPNYFIVFLRKIAICEELCLIFSQFAHNHIDLAIGGR
ncbi:hypothetical protein HMPREF1573_01125 [Gardnerella vaginalis JCP7276]|nr:hypothetical protein HMPREF1573_01125 [Gardnerella vaginalis JCP7276]